ncbi:MAG: BrnT family toxin [Acidobacteriota bacterium]
MRFEWDEEKNLRNWRKHGIRFGTAALVFDDPEHVLFRDRDVDGEERWHAIGLADKTTLLIVVHSYRDEDAETEVVRVISARLATRSERGLYGNG